MSKAYFINKVLATTVVGSYPVVKAGGFKSLFDPLGSAVETAVTDMIGAGIDIISDGQVRGDMIGAFAGKLPGIKGQEVVGKIQPAASAITVTDTKYAISKFPKVKGIVTGPSTLAHGLHISTPMYRNKEELALDLAAALVVEARSLEAAGAAVLQIDEPILSTGVADLATGKQAVEMIASSVRIPVCMHVCGNIANVIDEILKYNVGVFDFEFSKNQANLDILSRRDLTGKMLGYGCVDSTTDTVETVPEIRKRIEKAVEYFDPKILLIDPDCGMRMRTREAAYWKLKNMCEAAKEVRLAL
ncbi:methionine synthase [Methanoregula formicica]|uniref:Methionine synthase II (Cobalamin-independent) n=1 Tax=Methanoregula formicica (strain DSM 22288 / NBRC 105244 / SMSP) TaxID=593750 RepID=L0H999_METFS|nr:methionine synthase [Methanoregula formicica]AGB01312.1 methionine synthase II (cobalamin-independent) [Methanoregula formicica SMSP]